MRAGAARAEEFDFTPGQYVDLWVPGEPGERRSFSMANLPGDGRVELLIKRYPGGKLSGMLGSEIVAGSSSAVHGTVWLVADPGRRAADR